MIAYRRELFTEQKKIYVHYKLQPTCNIENGLLSYFAVLKYYRNWWNHLELKKLTDILLRLDNEAAHIHVHV